MNIFENNFYSPKYKVGQNDYYDDVIIGDLYMLMGRDLVAIESAPAGTIVGIGGLKSEMIVNSGTLSSTLDVPSFSPIYQDSVPILRVAVEAGFQIDTSTELCYWLTLSKPSFHWLKASNVAPLV